MSSGQLQPEHEFLQKGWNCTRELQLILQGPGQPASNDSVLQAIVLVK